MVASHPDGTTPFGRYFLVRRIGSGGMGEVWLAKSRGAAGFEKTLVIKRILPHLADDPEFHRRFVEEGHLVVQLTHGNIVQVYDLGDVDGETFIAMEYVDGWDLRDLIRRAPEPTRPFPPALTLLVLEELAAGLAYAHGRTDERGRPLRIVHRDISPSNVMISRDGAVKLLDFGIARSAASAIRTMGGTLRGKLPYMSPEQARGDELDPRSDLFGVGTLAYEMLTGQRPFDDPAELRVLDRVQHHEPPPVHAVAPDVPAVVSALIGRCMKKAREDRFATADELRRAVARARQELGQIVTSSDLAAVVAERAERPAGGLSLDAALALQLGGPGAATPGGTRTAVPNVRPTPVSGATAPRLPLDAPVTGTGQLVPPTRPQRLLLLLLAVAVAVLVFFNVRYLLRDEAVRSEQGPATSALPVQQDAAPVTAPVAPDVRSEAPPVAPPGPDTRVPLRAREDRAPELPVAVAERHPVEEDAARPAPSRTRPVTVRTAPAGGQISIDGGGTAKAPRTVQVGPDRAVSGVARLAGHRDEPFELRADGPRKVTVTLTPLASGTVQFRFFPADSRVLINDVAVSTGGSNIVRRALPVGRYRLVVQSRDGSLRTTRDFEVREGEERSLGTVALSTDGLQD